MLYIRRGAHYLIQINWNVFLCCIFASQNQVAVLSNWLIIFNFLLFRYDHFLWFSGAQHLVLIGDCRVLQRVQNFKKTIFCKFLCELNDMEIKQISTYTPSLKFEWRMNTLLNLYDCIPFELFFVFVLNTKGIYILAWF